MKGTKLHRKSAQDNPAEYQDQTGTSASRPLGTRYSELRTQNSVLARWFLLFVLLVGVASGCDSSVASSEPAGNAAIRDYPTPQGRILTANQAANSVSLIDVATDTAYGTVPTGQQPHHVVGTPDGKEFWV